VNDSNDAQTSPTCRVAVVGAGIAGAACASSLARAGFEVTVFERSSGAGGRMATRRAAWTDAEGAERQVAFDHGAPGFGARSARFRAVVGRAQALGHLARWRPRVHAEFPAPLQRELYVPLPTLPALCRHLLAGVPLLASHDVQRLSRRADGWHLDCRDGRHAGPFDQVMLAVPAPQAAALLADADADVSADISANASSPPSGPPMLPCWTLMAVTDEVDWPWDLAEPAVGPLARVLRADRQPGRPSLPGYASWVAQASTAWSAEHVASSADTVREALCAALRRQLPAGRVAWHHAEVHRWRLAFPAEAAAGAATCWWDPARQLGACNDGFGNGTVESGWRSGDELADTVAAWLEFNAPDRPAVAPRVEPSRDVEPARAPAPKRLRPPTTSVTS